MTTNSFRKGTFSIASIFSLFYRIRWSGRACASWTSPLPESSAPTEPSVSTGQKSGAYLPGNIFLRAPNCVSFGRWYLKAFFPVTNHFLILTRRKSRRCGTSHSVWSKIWSGNLLFSIWFTSTIIPIKCISTFQLLLLLFQWSEFPHLI